MKSQALLNYIEQLKDPPEFNIQAFINSHAPKQQEYLNSKARSTMFWGGKRAGKTLGSTSKAIIIDHIAQEGARIVFASATLDKIVSLYWKNFQTANNNLGLKWQFRRGQGMIITPRREIVFRSLRDIPSADKDVGFPVVAAFLDEPHTCREKVLKHWFNNIIRINFLNIKNPSMNITMNPPVFPMPFLTKAFYENPAVLKIHVTPNDNPSISKEELQKFLEEEAEELGYKNVEDAMENSNEFKRNILGLWIPDTGRLIFHKERMKTFEKLPEKISRYKSVIGVDIGGGKGQDAIAVICYNKFQKQAWVAEEKLLDTADQDTEDLANHIKFFYEKYTPHNVIIDTGGIGNRIANVLKRRYGVPGILPAKKQDKMSWLETMRTEVYKGRLLFKKDSEFLDEVGQIVYTPDFTEVDDDAGIHSDIMDAILYAYRFVHNIFPKDKKKTDNYKMLRIKELLNKRSEKKYGI